MISFPGLWDYLPRWALGPALLFFDLFMNAFGCLFSWFVLVDVKEVKMAQALMAAYKFGTYVPKPDFSKGITLFVIFVVIVGFAMAATMMIVKTFEK